MRKIITSDKNTELIIQYFHEPSKLPEKLQERVARIQFLFEQFRVERKSKIQVLRIAEKMFGKSYSTVLNDFNTMCLVFGDSLQNSRNMYAEMIFDKFLAHADELNAKLQDTENEKNYIAMAGVYTKTLAEASKHLNNFYPKVDDDKYKDLEIKQIQAQTDPEILGVSLETQKECEATAQKWLAKFRPKNLLN